MTKVKSFESSLGDTDTYRIENEALSGQMTTGVKMLVGAVASRMAKSWWSNQADVAEELGRRVCVHLEEFRGGVAIFKLDAAVEQAGQAGYADAVMDPLMNSLADVLREQGCEGERATTFIRCFLLEIVLVEAFRLEKDRPRIGERATSVLVEFIRRKAQPHVQSRLQPADAEDALAEVMSGLLGLGHRAWRRKTLLDFRRPESSLAAFVVTGTRYHVLDMLGRIGNQREEEVELDENTDFNFDADRDGVEPTVEHGFKFDHEAPDLRMGNDVPAVEDALKAVLGSGRDAPKVLDPSTPTGRKRLALIEAYLQSQLADERHGAHTCEEGTAQQKFVLVQGLPPCLATGSLGGEKSHPRFDDPELGNVSDRGLVLERGFAPDTCRTYTPKSGGKDEEWLHWRVLYTVAFFATTCREGLLDSVGPVFSRTPSSVPGPSHLDKKGIRQWCVRKNRDEPVPTDVELDRVQASYREWLAGDPHTAEFALQPTNGTIDASHVYPHVLLSSYAVNAFCSLFAGYRMGVPLAIDDLRFAFKDLKSALQTKGGRRERKG